MNIALLGTENTHAITFVREMQKDKEKYADINVVGICGCEEKANHQIKEILPNVRIYENFSECIGNVDAAMITSRHGKYHYEYALPLIKEGMPLFIDKPFADSPKHVKHIIELARDYGCPICGGSSLKHLAGTKELKDLFDSSEKVLAGTVCAPINMVNPYGDFLFYSQHLIELMASVFGYDVKSLYAYCPDNTKNRVTVIFNYGDFDVTAHYYDSYVYSAEIFAKICGKTKHKSVITDDVSDCFVKELDEFIELAKTRQMTYSYDEFAKPAVLLDAIMQSYSSQKIVKISYMHFE